MVRLLIAIALVTACTKTSEKYCGLHPEDLANCPPSDAARQMCTGDPECPAMAPHCLIEGSRGECVECISDGDCTAVGKLACDPDTRSCRSCVEHADCPGSMACLPEGTCGNDDQVIYVTQGGVNTGTCPVAAPCGTIAYALLQVTATRYHIKLSGVLAETVVIATGRVVVLADPGTKLTGADPTLKIQRSTVSIYDLEIACTPAGGGIKSEMSSTTRIFDTYVHGCGGKGGGIEVKGGFISITRARIGENPGGGIQTDAAAVFSITNTIIFRNGTLAAAKGGVTIGATTEGLNNRFEHNTVVHNQAKTGPTVAGGVACTLTNTLAMPNNIIAGNTTSTGVNDNTFGACGFTKSKIAVDVGEFAFVSTEAPFDYHMMAGSSAIDTVDVSTVDDDIDGQFRPQGPRRDHGADEYKP